MQSNVNRALNNGNGHDIDWITTVKVLKGKLKQHNDIVIKIGDSIVKKEIEIGKIVGKQRGFIRFLGHFHCHDDYLDHNGKSDNKNQRKKVCKGKGADTSVIIMPYYPHGSVGDYKWKIESLPVLKSLLKQALLFYLAAYDASKFIHGDLHAKNILISTTSLKTVRKTFKDKDTIKTIVIPTLGHTAVLMDFENSKFGEGKTMDLVNLYYDVQKLFQLLPSQITWLSPQSVQSIIHAISTSSINLLPWTSMYLVFDMIDEIY